MKVSRTFISGCQKAFSKGSRSLLLKYIHEEIKLSIEFSHIRENHHTMFRIVASGKYCILLWENVRLFRTPQHSHKIASNPRLSASNSRNHMRRLPWIRCRIFSIMNPRGEDRRHTMFWSLIWYVFSANSWSEGLLYFLEMNCPELRDGAGWHTVGLA